MKTIEIYSSQHVPIEFELATPQSRMIAIILDLIVFSGGYFLMVIVFKDFILDDHWMVVAVSFFPFLGFILYMWLWELLSGGQSIGKRAMKLRVMRLDGRPPQPADFLIRAVFLAIDFFLTLGALAGVCIGSTAYAQRMGDLAAGTVVVNLKPAKRFSLEDLLNISTLENYSPLYPQAKQLTDSDVLLLKDLLKRYSCYPNKAHKEALALATQTLCERLNIQKAPGISSTEFIKRIIRDYIVLTR